MIELQNLYIKFDDKYYDLYNINLKVNKDEKICLLGDSVSGNDLLIRCLLNLEFHSGKILIENQILNNKTKKIYRSGFAYLSKNGIFFEDKTVLENMLYIYKIRKKNIEEDKIYKQLKYYEIDHLANKKVSLLTKRERVLLSLARLSLRKFDIFLSENVFSGLTEKDKGCILKHIKKIVNTTNTVIIALDDISLSNEMGLTNIQMKFGSIINK